MSADLLRSKPSTEDTAAVELRAELAELRAEVMSLRMIVAHLRGSQTAVPLRLRPVLARAILAEEAHQASVKRG